MNPIVPSDISSVVYSWIGPSINSSNQSSLSLSNLCPGSYTLVATVNGNCFSTRNVIVSSLSNPTFSASITTDVCNSCNNSINVSTASVNSILWNNSGIIGMNPANLCAGVYSGVITSPNGCSVSINANVVIPTPTNYQSLSTAGTQNVNASNQTYNTIYVQPNTFLSLTTSVGTYGTVCSIIEVRKMLNCIYLVNLDFGQEQKLL